MQTVCTQASQFRLCQSRGLRLVQLEITVDIKREGWPVQDRRDMIEFVRHKSELAMQTTWSITLMRLSWQLIPRAGQILGCTDLGRQSHLVQV